MLVKTIRKTILMRIISLRTYLSMLYFVPTPIGNKEDITLRGLRLLKETELFFCEDTATSKKLMNMYEISLTGKQFFPLTSFTDE